ncbi:valyl-tRNA synthetase [Saprolegnia diclina VS20]|uniref:valine--tRNA ligase n=1 Tax=Saprolegnia diclina (strain VS20) TaxID=1156394 RepID=T0S9S4_SAPDV|nr:valyl-tRNA synthetase [Saprolegnia diclina VS20]EQC39507.1 valyl-tRNA synthetase [Saprolegnia diclina VS20]|eukprot:XP_008606779.1 valyl-tRNA synthetase [Saprolegnia diclina VS20]
METPSAAAPAPAQPEGEKLSKKAQKKAEKGKLKPAKEKDPNRWAPKKEKEVKPVKEVAPEQEFVNLTPVGEKKDMTTEMATGYQPVAVEAAWQAWWEKEGYFRCDDAKIKNAPKDKRFVMVIPPPNVTGSLHLGHALTVAVQDTLTRWHRMLGHATLWVPGTDHAGIATQSVVEKRLMKDEGKSRHDLGRDAFLDRVWEWKNEYETRIHHQFRKVGCSVDWERAYFSMDDRCTRATMSAFNKLFDEGLIYRATRMINWSCKLKTAISDIEVDYLDLEGRTKLAVPGHNPDRKYEFGVITSFAYPVENSTEQLIVATTRLETMLGDSAVAIHPEDPRYKHLHGKFVVHPFNNRRIPIICDAELVDMSFGTGAVKITPAHDPNDYECGKRHNLEFITVIDDDGKINPNGGSLFEGMMRYDARVAMEKALAEKGLFHGKADNKMRLGICSRSGDIVEPLVKPQWFVNCQQMADDAMAAVRNKELTILPEHHEKTWFRWLENIRDWCISRQLWWGHRIPAYFATIKNEPYVDPNSEANVHRWVAGTSEADARAKAAAKLQVPEAQIELKQDDDVLDTWVSAGLFPFAVFGWPDNKEEMADYYPTDLLETGYDILFFWVVRMVFMGQKLTGKLPFHTVYLHSIVRDKYGRKMSKSLGNVVDPLEVIAGCTLETLLEKLESGNLPPKEIEKAKKGQMADFPQGIPECGADALRFGLLAYQQQVGDINLDIQRLVGYRNFCNKLWNATRFAMTNLEGGASFHDGLAATVLSNKSVAPRDRFILSRLHATIAAANTALQTYAFGDVTTALYNFWLYDVCDVYLELIKPVIAGTDADAKKTAQETLFLCLEMGLRLLHPIMPFVTEELWQRLPGKRATSSIVVAAYPEATGAIATWANPAAEANMELIKDIIHAGRSLRAEYGLANAARPLCYLKCADASLKAIVETQVDDFGTLAKVGSTTCLLDTAPPSGCAMHVLSDKLQLHVSLTGLVDFANEISKLEKKLEKMLPSLTALEKKRARDDYLAKVPANVRDADATKWDALQKEKVAIEGAMAMFAKCQLDETKA